MTNQWIANLIIERRIGVLTSVVNKWFPTQFLKMFYSNNKKTDWNGKKSCFTLSFDCDFTADIQAIPALLDMLTSYSIKTNFACIGKFIEKYPKVHEKMIDDGHEIINHTYTHPDNEEWNPNQKFNELTIEQQREEIYKCHEVCKNILDYIPMGFRTPHFGELHTDSIYDIIKELGYKYSSSTIAVKTPKFGLPYIKDSILEFPLSPCPKHLFTIFDTWHSFERGNGEHKAEKEFYKLFKQLIEIGIKTNSYINVYFDPQDIVKLKEFKMMLDYVEEKEKRKDIWVARYEDIVRRWKDGR